MCSKYALCQCAHGEKIMENKNGIWKSEIINDRSIDQRIKLNPSPSFCCNHSKTVSNSKMTVDESPFIIPTRKLGLDIFTFVLLSLSFHRKTGRNIKILQEILLIRNGILMDPLWGRRFQYTFGVTTSALKFDLSLPHAHNFLALHSQILSYTQWKIWK